jgi:hypothetical protein
MRAVNIELLISEGTTCKLNSRHSIPGEEDSYLPHHTQSGTWPQWGYYCSPQALSVAACSWPLILGLQMLGTVTLLPHTSLRQAPGSISTGAINNILTTVTIGFPACHSFSPPPPIKLFPEHTRYVPPCATVCCPYTSESTVALGLNFLQGPFLLRRRALLQFFKTTWPNSTKFCIYIMTLQATSIQWYLG